MLFEFDSYNRYEIPVLKIANPNFAALHMIREPRALTVTPRLLSTSEASFEVRQFDAYGQPNHVYDDIKKYRLVHIGQFKWFVITSVTEATDGFCGVKTVSCQSYEYTLGRKDIDLDAGTYPLWMLDDTEGVSLLGHICKKYPRWKVDYVSAELMGRYRTFDMPEDSVYAFLTSEAAEAFECLFVFGFDETDGKGVINAYSAADLTKDSEIVLRYQSLLKDAKVTDVSDDVVTALKCYGASEFSIADVNPLGTPYIYDFSYYKDWMSEGLWAAVQEWQDAVDAAITNAGEGSYSSILEQIKTGMQSIQNYQSKLADVEALRSAVGQVYTANSPYELSAATNTALESIEEWWKALSPAEQTTFFDDAVAYPMVPIIGDEGHTVPAAIASYAATISETDKPVAEAVVNDVACQCVALDINDAITDIEAEVADLRAQLQTLHNDLSLANNFTPEQLAELEAYTIASVYENQYIAKLENDTYAKIQEKAMELYQSGKIVLERIHEPAYTVEVTLRNFLFDHEYEGYIHEMALGRHIHAEIKEDEWVSPILLEFTVNFDNPADLTIGLGSNYRASFTQDVFQDLFEQSAKTTSTVSNSIGKLNNPARSDEISALQKFMRGSLDLTKNAVVSGVNQDFRMDSSGILGRKVDPDTGLPDPRQVKLTNTNLMFTDDAWRTAKAAYGEIQYADGSTGYGLIADDIVASGISADRITSGILMSANGQLKFDLDNGELIFGSGGDEVSLEDRLSNINNANIIESINSSTEKEYDTDGNVMTETDDDGNVYDKPLRLRADKISLEGLISANKNFKIDLDGNMEARDGTFFGQISSDDGAIGDLSSIRGQGSTFAGDVVVSGKLVVSGEYPTTPVTPASAGISPGQSLVVPSSSSAFGTLPYDTLTVWVGNNSYELIRTTSVGTIPTQGSGSTSNNNYQTCSIIKKNPDVAGVLMDGVNGDKLGLEPNWYYMDTGWYICENRGANWFFIKQHCTYNSNGTVTPGAIASPQGYVNLGVTKRQFLTDRPLA